MPLADETVAQKTHKTPSIISNVTMGGIGEEWRSEIVPEASERVVYLYDHTEQNFVTGAESLCELYGFTTEELLTFPEGWLALIHQEDVQRVRQSSQIFSESGDDHLSIQMRVICKDGHWEWIKHDQKILSRDANGQRTRTAGLVQIITHLALSNQMLSNEASLASLHRMLVEEWAEGIYLLDSSWSILYINQSAQKGLGYTQEELFGHPFSRICRFDVPRKIPKVGQNIVLRVQQLRRDGTEMPVEITFRRVSELRLLATTRDITKQLAAEETARRQTAYYRGLFENNPSGVAVLDGTFRIVEINEALKRMLGFRERQMIGSPFVELADTVSKLEVERWQQMAIGSEKLTTQTEITMRRRDGRIMHAQTALTIIPGPTPQQTQCILLINDVTARHLVEKELAQQHQLNDKLLRESTAMIGMLDPEGRIIMMNAVAEQVSGYKTEEIVGKYVWDCGIVDKEECANVKSRIQQILDGAQRVTGVSRARTKTGELRILQVQNTATRDAFGEVETIIITAVDVTEQHRLQQHLMEAVEQEQARIGHDLHDGVGQLLTGIGAMTEGLKSELSGRQQEDAARIFELVRQAIHQVRQLSHTMSPAAVQHRELADSLRLLADNVRTSFRRDCDSDLDTAVKVRDGVISGHLFRIAQEAINNGIRHGNPKHLSISLKRDGNEHGLLEIANDGESFDCRPGSPAEGIGIRVMKHRASLIQAALSITSPPSGGIRVACRFPLPPADRPSPPTKPKR